MSLFVGNISKNIKEGELEKEFEKFGTCKFRNKVPSPSQILILLCHSSPYYILRARFRALNS